MANSSFGSNDYWSATWRRHIDAYLAATPRCGIWLQSFFSAEDFSFLECAGGSCRDSRYLFKNQKKALGCDFDEHTIKYVNEYYSASGFVAHTEDASRLRYSSKSFDIVFHNGFWILFDDDQKLCSLLAEQVRVARLYAVVLVHNKRNQALVDAFADKSLKDDLYKIRFFDIDALMRIVELSGITFGSVSCHKFGGPVDRLYSLGKKLPFLMPLARWVVPRLYRYQPWSRVERIALVLELDGSPA